MTERSDRLAHNVLDGKKSKWHAIIFASLFLGLFCFASVMWTSVLGNDILEEYGLAVAMNVFFSASFTFFFVVVFYNGRKFFDSFNGTVAK